jgi:hypothetical protein
MQEFFSIAASSYDAESLAPMLTEKSAEGWAVVSIVAAGTNIVAYLSRPSAGSGATSGKSDGVSVAASSVAAAAVAEMPATASASDLAVASEVTDAGSDPADAAAAGAEATDAYAAAVVDTPTLPGDATPYVPADSSISTEPAGWAAAPDNDVADLAALVGADDIATNTAAADITAEQAVDAAAVEAVDEPSVPAGWYADPSGRYELRYWDGGAWTEHVSRAGQQFTDPPVA